tara:strand:+ start:599 stop:775 length:177 start_codon:yes stop_codon:yes gene_type:complete
LFLIRKKKPITAREIIGPFLFNIAVKAINRRKAKNIKYFVFGLFSLKRDHKKIIAIPM